MSHPIADSVRVRACVMHGLPADCSALAPNGDEGAGEKAGDGWLNEKCGGSIVVPALTNG